MKISNNQLMALIKVLDHACRFYGNFADIPHDDLVKLYNEIMNQQGDELVEIK